MSRLAQKLGTLWPMKSYVETINRKVDQSLIEDPVRLSKSFDRCAVGAMVLCIAIAFAMSFATTDALAATPLILLFLASHVLFEHAATAIRLKAQESSIND